jgi:hypothetical protein
MKSLKKMFFITLIVCGVLSGGATGSLWGSCSAINECGDWCTTVGIGKGHDIFIRIYRIKDHRELKTDRSTGKKVKKEAIKKYLITLFRKDLQ